MEINNGMILRLQKLVLLTQSVTLSDSSFNSFWPLALTARKTPFNKLHLQEAE